MLLGIICVCAAILTGVSCVLSGAFHSLAWLWVLPVSLLGSLLVMVLLAFVFLWVCCAVVRTDKPQEKDSPFYRRLAKLYIDAVLTLSRTHIHTTGAENIPKDGRFMLVCNHTHAIDPAILLTVFPESQLAFVSKKENDSLFLAGKVLHKIMCQPIDRENDRAALKTILNCVRLLKEDQVSIGVFPEGYVSKDRKLRHFRNGVFKIAQKAKVPVVVCTLKNTRDVLPNFTHFKHTDVYMDLVGVIPAEEAAGVTTVELGERIYQMMAQSLGPDLVYREEELP